MNSRNSRGRDVHGILVLDKPSGITSNAALQKVKRLFGAKKVGHTGSLDPLATGALPLCFGEATKFSQFLLNADKRYQVQAVLGISTDSGDAEGTICSERSWDHVQESDLEDVLPRYRGEIEQVPSMFSAVKNNGQPLYKLARQGLEVPREPRSITIYSNQLASFQPPEFTLDVHCSKGTYVRTLVADIGEELRCGAHVVALRRIKVGPFNESRLVTLDEVEDACKSRCSDDLLQPTWSAVGEWPAVYVAGSNVYNVKHGQPVRILDAPEEGWVRLCELDGGSEEKFLGIGEVLVDGRVAPRRMLA